MPKKNIKKLKNNSKKNEKERINTFKKKKNI